MFINLRQAYWDVNQVLTCKEICTSRVEGSKQYVWYKEDDREGALNHKHLYNERTLQTIGKYDQEAERWIPGWKNIVSGKLYEFSGKFSCVSYLLDLYGTESIIMRRKDERVDCVLLECWRDFHTTPHNNLPMKFYVQPGISGWPFGGNENYITVSTHKIRKRCLLNVKKTVFKYTSLETFDEIFTKVRWIQGRVGIIGLVSAHEATHRPAREDWTIRWTNDMPKLRMNNGKDGSPVRSPLDARSIRCDVIHQGSL